MTATTVLDLHGVTTKSAFMDRCAEQLRLPGWFGRNWDALADVLSDPGLWSDDGSEDAVEEETVVVVRNWDRYAGARPDEWATAREVFSQASALTVALALGGSS